MAVDTAVKTSYGAGVKVWWGDPEKDWGLATLEGGDVMPAGNGVVLIGMSERSSRQAISQVAAALFAAGAAERVFVARLPKIRSRCVPRTTGTAST
jgi:arginine deiminase